MRAEIAQPTAKTIVTQLHFGYTITVLHLGAFYVRKCAPWQIIRVEM